MYVSVRVCVFFFYLFVMEHKPDLLFSPLSITVVYSKMVDLKKGSFFFFCWKPKQKLQNSALTVLFITQTPDSKSVIICDLKNDDKMQSLKKVQWDLYSILKICTLCLFANKAEWSDSFLWMPQLNFTHPSVPAVIWSQRGVWHSERHSNGMFLLSAWN